MIVKINNIAMKNKMLKNRLKYVLFIITSMFFISNGFAQTTTASTTVPASSIGSISINVAMAAIAGVLLFVIMVLWSTVNTALEFYKQNKVNKTTTTTIIKSILLLVSIFGVQYAFSQSQSQLPVPVKEITNPANMVSTLYFYGFSVLIIVELLIIFFFLYVIRYLTGIDKVKSKSEEIAAKNNTTWWQSINKLRPIEEEDSMDTGHNYDGIRELDNITPPWFIAAFAATIIFAFVYIYRYQIVHSAPSQLEEYETEMREAKIVQDSLLKLEGNSVDENTVTMLGKSDIDAGHKLYIANCAACHGELGQGGVGPDFADDYWLHKGSIKDIFISIKYGWVDKGMKSWKEDFSPIQIAQLASFVKSLKGTNPPGAKEKQGELYVDEAPSVSAPEAVK